MFYYPTMKSMFCKFPLNCFVLTLVLLITGCANTANNTTVKTPATPYSDKQNAVTVMSEEGKYRVSVYSNVYPLPMSKIHHWFVHVERPDGTPVENAKIYVHGGMPAHQHGFPTKPRIDDYLGDGNYRIDGIKFSMPGHWELRLNIKEETVRDRVIFNIDL